jgi:2-isopropylmalate synthase
MKPDVEVVLQSKGKAYKEATSGDGPVDACYKAIEAITKMKGELLDYSIHSVTRGKDALGEVTVKVKIKDKSVVAQGTSTDILEASAKAYINAINKVLSQQL